MKRIIGIDVARALAVFGMIIVNFKTVFGAHGSPWLNTIAGVFDGKAAATFVVLAGVGLALTTNRGFKNQDHELLKLKTGQIAKRAVLLFIIGLSYITIWPADILHFYGIYMLVCLGFIRLKPQYALYGAVAFIGLFPLLLVGFDYEAGWDFNTLSYLDFRSVNGFIRHLFFNGFHPVIPWVSFMLFGLWFGRQDLKNTVFLKRALGIGAAGFIGIQLVSKGLIYLLTFDSPDLLEDIVPILGTEPMPPFPFYMINGISAATVIITSCILIAERFKHSHIIHALYKTGQLALTFYVAHVIVGMGLVELVFDIPFGDFSIIFSTIYALIFGVMCILFATFWLKHKTLGPLEWLMKKLNN